MGTYIPLSDLDTLEFIQKVWEQNLKGCKPLLIGNLNIDLGYPRNDRGEEVAEEFNSMGLEYMMMHHYRQHCSGVNLRG